MDTSRNFQSGTYETASELGLVVFFSVPPILYFRPPVLELVKTVLAGKLFQQFHGYYRTNTGKPLDVVASKEICQTDECVAFQPELPR